MFRFDKLNFSEITLLKKNLRNLISLVFTLLIFVCPLVSQGQMNPNSSEFGKNRIQFEERYWFFYNFEDFDIFFYQGGEKLAQSAAKYVEASIEQVENRLNFDLKDKIQLIVYK